MFDAVDSRYATDERLRTIPGIAAEARRHLSDAGWDYLWTGVGDEETHTANNEEFSRWRFRTALFTGISRPVTNTEFLGMNLSFPLLIAPFGNDKTFHPDGHLAVGRAAAANGIAQMVPVASSFTLEAVAKASSAAAVYQMVMVGDEEDVLQMIGRAQRAGYRYICANYSATLQWRERLFENAWSPPAGHVNVNYATDLSNPAMLREFREFTRPRWTWDAVARVAKQSPLPFIYKGIETPEDAQAAVEAGACALYVSNFGGRTIDRQPPTLQLLPAVREAAGPDMPIILDSGIRRGSDIATALALGADVVAIGRLAALGLAAGGEHGVSRVLGLLRREFWMTLGHLGCSNPAELKTKQVLYPRVSDSSATARRPSALEAAAMDAAKRGI